MSRFHLTCRELVKTYGNAFRLGPLSLDVTGGVTCLVGPNGAGKSTFFRLAAGLEKQTSGTLRLEAATSSSPAVSLGYLPQDPELPPGATCEEFLHYVAWVHAIPAKRRPSAVDEALAAPASPTAGPAESARSPAAWRAASASPRH